MEPGWVPGDPNTGAGPSQAYSSWPENLLAFDLEGGNYGPALSGGASSKLASGGLVDEEVQRKRKRELLEKESLDMFLAELGKEPPPSSAPEAAGSGSNEDAAGLAGLDADRRTDAKLPDAASAARNKACRERMRRERLNDRYRGSKFSIQRSLRVIATLGPDQKQKMTLGCLFLLQLC